MNVSDFLIEEGKLIKYKGTGEEIIIPDGVTTISASAFSNCTKIKSVTIPAGVTKIGKFAFRGCTSLSEVDGGNGVTEINYMTFCDCKNLVSFVVPGSVKSIEPLAFRGCTNLESITLPETLERIGDSAFVDCVKLFDIKMPHGIPKMSFVDRISLMKANRNAPFYVRIYLFGDETRNSEFDSACRDEILNKPVICFLEAIKQNSVDYAEKILSVIGKPEEQLLMSLIEISAERNSSEITQYLREYKNKNY